MKSLRSVRLMFVLCFAALLFSACTQPITATSIAAGSDHTCAFTSGGGVKCWGTNGSGELGDGTRSLWHGPVDVTGLTSGVTAIALGADYTCAVTGGGAKCWGDNQFSTLGDGTTIARLSPMDVKGLSSGVTAIAAGGNCTCALTSSSGVKCWGWNGYGQLGDGTTTDRLTPVDVDGLTSGVSAIVASGTSTCALTNSGGVKCWGDNGYGQLGDGAASIGRPSPVDVRALTSGVTAIALASDYTCALMSSGGVKCWGSLPGTVMNQYAPLDVEGLTSGVTAIAAGSFHACALTSSGGVKCWGQNDFGQLGDGTTNDRTAPVDVKGLTSGVSAIAVGHYHTCALMSGGVKCWGLNRLGELGDGTTMDRHSPVGVVGFAPQPGL